MWLIIFIQSNRQALDLVIVPAGILIGAIWLVHFIVDILKNQDVIVLRDPDEKIVTFLNIIPDFAPDETTYDMFRRTADPPNGAMDAVILKDNIDQPFIQQLESKNETIKFNRIDTDLTDSLKAKTSKKSQKELKELSVELT